MDVFDFATTGVHFRRGAEAGALMFGEHLLQVGEQAVFVPVVIIPSAIDEESGGAIDAAVDTAVEIRIDLCGQGWILHIVFELLTIEFERFGEGIEGHEG